MGSHLASPWSFHLGIVTQIVLGGIAGQLDDLTVLCQVGDVQVEGDAALLGALHIARTTQFHVLLGHDETVVGLGHHLQAVTRVSSQVTARHQDAIALIGTAPYPAAQLMQL